jgi:thiol-disulfide isomerase/thioredoxin
VIAAAALLAGLVAGPVDAAQVRTLVAAQKGRPVLLNLWATWCAPCVAEFPDLVRLAQEHAGEVVVISVSIDDAAERSAVEAFVQKQNPPFPVYLKKPGPDEAFIDGIDPRWSGSLPASLVFDGKGRKKALLEGEHSREEIERLLLPRPRPTRR